MARKAEKDSNKKDDDKANKRPTPNAFQQQRLRALQPILTPKSVLPLFFAIGVIFAPLGGVLLWASAQVKELEIDYTNCKEAPVGHYEQIPSDQFSYTFPSTNGIRGPFWERNSTEAPFTCTLTFDIPQDMGPPVYMYYRLTEFYQNHRKYVKSLNIEQLKGEAVDNKTLNGGTLSKCDPNDLMLDCGTMKAFYPAGTIANSMFNDTIYSPWKLESTGGRTLYNMTNKGIAQPSDKELIKPTKYKPWQVVPPPNWQDRYPNNYTEQNLPNLQEEEEFLVWMRTAALPDFSKMSRRNDSATLELGTYQLSIDYRFPVTEYKGTKSIFISTRTAVGGKNSAMGIAYVVVGGFCCLVGALFTIAHTIRPRKLGDESYLSWNKEDDSSAVASGNDHQTGSHAP
ncbi:hypothetical protein ASPWEDRAFT_36965 [Aspergillus wentii DTO 134E9]|uniref:Uncharacterized protein n=1 Tax=Aspergillus wentii DTO 134E9 TaxID=1073089 RepID=A0A1L9RWC2_ASPWE|nr:uncharacterized protein ASPWEDRAFT_36965 [Aspergillus wentii DTO 134E9]KAI9929080.1 hypothetical protein MW887_001483 [Aspergillus wentii]OJJ39226.1 hypothetical protein ASPWEDRAFT_36965 [Aspergillus wentii DTO 134E9]